MEPTHPAILPELIHELPSHQCSHMVRPADLAEVTDGLRFCEPGIDRYDLSEML